MAATQPTVRIMATSMEASRRTARTAIHRGKPTDHGWETKVLENDHCKVGKVMFLLKTMGLLPSALLFWKCWKDQWKEGGWPSKLVVKINQKCEVDHPNCSWNQKNADFQASGANYQTWSVHFRNLGCFKQKLGGDGSQNQWFSTGGMDINKNHLNIKTRVTQGFDPWFCTVSLDPLDPFDLEMMFLLERQHTAHHGYHVLG